MTEPAPIRVLIVDHHEGVRLGLTTALAVEEDLLIVGEAASGREALRRCGALQPDVVLMEIALPDLDGLSLIQQIRRQFPHIEVVVLTTAQAADLKHRAEQAGARDYLQKYVAVDALVAVIRATRPASVSQVEGMEGIEGNQMNTHDHMHGHDHTHMSAGSSDNEAFSRDTTGLSPATVTEIVDLADGEAYDLIAGPVLKLIGDVKARLLAYNGSVPGPTLRVRQGSTVTVNFTNQIDLETTVHWHGLRHENRFDGVPTGAHQGMQPPIPVGGSYTYSVHFPDPGLYWYHPHIREDYTQELGLYGNIIVVPDAPDYWPPVNRELTLVLDDILVEDGQVAAFSPGESSHIAMGRYGNVLLVNGDDSYQMEASQGEVIRLYLTNTANARPFNVRIPGVRMKLVGGDLGRVERETFVDEVLLAPAERVIIDAHFPRAGRYALEHRTPDRTYELGAFLVGENPAEPSYAAEFETLRRSPEFEAIRARIEADFDRQPDKVLSIVGEMPGMSHHGGHGGHHMGHHGHAMPEEIEWEDTMPDMNRMSTPHNMFWKLIDEETGLANHDIAWTFKTGSQVKIRLVNDPHSDHPMQHPIHFHGQRFLVLSRDGVRNENLAWEDTVLVKTGETVDLLLDASNPGAWMVHCHIAEHLESHMMFTFHVTEDGHPQGQHAPGHHHHG